MAFEPGQRIGDYEIVARLGAGGLGVVYEVQHLISQRREALKILLPDQSGTPEMVERFRREVQTLATLSHVNIAQLHTAFYYENQLAMIMELIHGETLRDLRARMAITLTQALDYVAQILQALVYAPWPGRGASRHQAVQHHDHPGRLCEAARFRHRAYRARQRPDPCRLPAGLAQLHVSPNRSAATRRRRAPTSTPWA